MYKRIIAMLLAAVLCVGLFPAQALAAGQTRTVSDETVTRAQWIGELVDVFEMTVEDEIYPDNYFSDLSEESEYYYDMLLAVEFGVIDVEAGEAVYPDEPATREFAASTLNFCLGFTLNEGEEYTYSDVDAVTYHDHVQIAVERGWFELVDGAFCPELAITAAEQETMLADATAVLEADTPVEDYESSVTFADGVVEVPKGTAYELVSDTVITLTDCTAEITAGDIFVVYNGDLPAVMKAEAVETVDNVTTITFTYDGTDDAITACDYEDTLEVDLEDFQGTEATTLSVNGQTMYISGTARKISYNDGTKTLTASKTVSLGDGIDATISVTIYGLKFDLKADFWNGKYRCVMVGDVNLSTNLSVDVMDALGAAKTVPLGYVNILGVGYVELSVHFSLTGEVSLVWKGDIEAGFTYNRGDGHIRTVRNFTKKSFTFMTEVNLTSGLRLEAGINALVFRCSIWSEVGAKMRVASATYDSGSPTTCVDMSGYMYASVGVGGDIIGIITFGESYDIYTASNSPIRAHYHYEDGAWVGACTRGEDWSKYYTDPGSHYFTPGTRNGSGSYNNVVIYTYTLDDDNNATITGYYGGGSALYIPATIDGFTVVAIGQGAFKGKTIFAVKVPNTVTTIGRNAFSDCKFLMTVTLPDSVTTIDAYAFSACTALTSIVLPANLEVLGCGVFKDCTALAEVNIPKDVETGEYCGSNYMFPGPFSNCTNLKNVTFDEGTTTVATALFYGCTGLTEISFPDTVTTINVNAFLNCTNLKTVTLPKNLTDIGRGAFCNCTSIETVVLPAGMATLGCSAFKDCTALTSVNIPKDMVCGEHCGSNYMFPGPFSGCSSLVDVTFGEGITRIPGGLFYGCNGVTEIVIPDTVTCIESKAFADCTALKTVELPDVLTNIYGYAFIGCTALESVTLPDSLTELGCGAFQNCTSLASVYIPKITVCGEYCAANYMFPGPFSGCSSLVDVTFGEGITRIPEGMFYGCSGPMELVIPDTVEEIQYKAFLSCGMVSVELPEGLTTIASQAFEGCSSLISVKLPESLTSLGNNVFAGSSSMETATWTTSIDKLNEGTFNGCTSLKTVENVDHIVEICGYAFNKCESLEFEIPEGVTSIGKYAFYNCDALTELVIPEGVTYIGGSAYYDCDGLTSITVPDSVTDWGSHIFYDCDALTDVKLGTGVTKLPKSTFEHCDVLTTVTLPRRIATVESCAFKNCVALTGITVPRSVTSIASDAFSYPDKMTIYGIAGTYAETYATEKSITFVDSQVHATAVTLDRTELVLWKGKTDQLTITVDPEDFTDLVAWKSGDTSIVTVDDNGVVTAVGVGEAVIKVSVGDDASAACTVTVRQPVTGITLSTSIKSMQALETLQLTATVKPSDAYDTGYTWSSSDESVATVDSRGLVTALSKGSAVITATATDGCGASKSCAITVTNTAHIATSVDELESEHKYPNSCSDFWVYTLDGAENLLVTFDGQTSMENGFDYLYVYDGEGNEIGKYTGTQLAGVTLEIPGDTVRIQLKSDASGNDWGFKVTSVEEMEVHVHDYQPTVTDPTCTEQGYTTYTCACGDSYVDDYVDATGHTYGDWYESKAPNENEDGERRRDCTCGAYETEVVENNPFSDIPEGKYYTTPVLWAYHNGITSGTSDTAFGASNTCTRAHVMTFLWKAAGSPEPETTENPFTDVKPTNYYYKAVLWAVENGITSGTGNGTFSPGKDCTRAQVVTFLWNAAGRPEPETTVNPFTDVKSTNYYYKAVLWAVENGITSGTGNGTFSPGKTCTRAQVMTFLYTTVVKNEIELNP